MKILISGASGYLGMLLRGIFQDDEITLLSRKAIPPRKTEKWFLAGNLQDRCWWNSLPLGSSYDAVFHLAEAVKKDVTNNVRQKIIDSHVAFIRHFAENGAKVVYPLTAYLYDTVISRRIRCYTEIKRGVYSNLLGTQQVSFPIIHPIYDSGDGLGSFVRLGNRIPLVNVLCAFDSSLPILRTTDLLKAFSKPLMMVDGRFDIYSEIVPIRKIFERDNRANWFALSEAMRIVLKHFTGIASVNLLVNGRGIDLC